MARFASIRGQGSVPPMRIFGSGQRSTSDSASILLELPFSIVQRAHLPEHIRLTCALYKCLERHQRIVYDSKANPAEIPSFQPAGDAVEVECMVANSPSYSALFTGVGSLVGLYEPSDLSHHQKFQCNNLGSSNKDMPAA